MLNTISSKDNALVKHIRSLTKKKYRKKYMQFVVEGKRIVKEAIVYAKVDKLIFSKSVNEKLREEIVIPNELEDRVYIFEDSVFNSISTTVNPSGVMAVCDINRIEIKNTFTYLLWLEDIKDPGNLGTIIRTSEAAGVDCIYATRGCVDLYNPKVIRSAMGSAFRVPYIVVDDIDKEIESLKSEKFSFIAAHLEGDDLDNTNIDSKKRIIFIGNEANGLSYETSKICETKIKIPMKGKVESLNAAIATSILLYHFRKK